MERLAVAALALCLVTSSQAAECLQSQAIYTEKSNGYELRFRPTLPWEASANVMAILDLKFPDGETSAWGWIWLPNGTSHDRIEFFTQDCKLPTFDPKTDIDPTPGPTKEEFEACSVWEGVIYALADSEIAELRWFDGGKAADTLLLPNIGPTIRYSGLVLSPGQEPHDGFTYKGCAG